MLVKQSKAEFNSKILNREPQFCGSLLWRFVFLHVLAEVAPIIGTGV